MRFEVRGDAVDARQRNGDEVHRLLQAVVGFGATEAEEAGTGFVEPFAADVGDGFVLSGKQQHRAMAHSASEMIILGSRGTSFIFNGSTKKSKSSRIKAPIRAV